MTLHWTTPEGLHRHEIIRVNGTPVRIRKVTEGQLTYRGRVFDVVYVKGIAAGRPVAATLLRGTELVAAH